MNRQKILTRSLFTGLAIAVAGFVASPAARANVFASNIKLNGGLTNASVNAGAGATISYILNEPATLGVTLNILSGTNVVRSYSFANGTAGALRGSNVVTWDGKTTGGTTAGQGTYGVSITAAAGGFTNWTQTSIDTNSGMPSHYSLGIAVDNNTNSAYYGRVVMGCALHTGAANVPPAGMKTGLFKMNADGTQADEGWYGNANYLADDGGDAPVAGQFPDSGGFDPMKIRIGEDDRIYWVDNSRLGRIVAADILATTNQIVLDEPGWATMDAHSDTSDGIGFQEFDVLAVNTTNAALFLPDNDFPNWGVWMFRMTNGVSDPNDTEGTQAVYCDSGGGNGLPLELVSSGGCMVDYNLNIWVGESRSHDTAANEVYMAMEFTNWNGGVLPPGHGGYNYSTGLTADSASWGYGTGVNQVGAGDPTFESIRDVVIDSRVHPTMLACPMSGGSDNGGGGGIRVLDANTGNLIAVTNTDNSVQVLTNIDYGQAYTAAAWDNVGNLYGVSTSRNLWRVWSPPGTNQSTTVSVLTLNVVAPPTPVTITGTTLSNGNTISITFSGSSSDTPSSFTLLTSTTPIVAASYTPVSGAIITQVSPGVFHATATISGSVGFYRIKHN